MYITLVQRDAHFPNSSDEILKVYHKSASPVRTGMNLSNVPILLALADMLKQQFHYTHNFTLIQHDLHVWLIAISR